MVHGGVPMTGGTRKPGYTIQVTGLSTSIRKTDLQGAFGEYGQISRIDLAGTKAYLQYDEKVDALDAIKAWDGKKFQGCSLRCEMKASGTPHAARIAGKFEPRDR